jgi:CBS domain-containing protein
MRVIGFISEFDLLDALLAQRMKTATARDIMSHPVLVADEFMPVDEVMSLLREGGVHHLPVVRQERLVGIITPHDVLRHFVEHELPIPPEEA